MTAPTEQTVTLTITMRVIDGPSRHKVHRILLDTETSGAIEGLLATRLDRSPSVCCGVVITGVKVATP